MSQLTYLRIDEKYYPDVIKKTKSILEEANSHKASIFNADFWNWQYRDLPTGDTRIYGVILNEEIMAYYHMPVFEILVKGKRKRFAMVQEVAVNRELRGKGVFRKLADLATRELKTSNIDAVYTFPNHKSIHTFLKYNGYTKVCTLGTYILPARSGAVFRSKINLLGLEKIVGSFVDIFFNLFTVKLDRGTSVSLHPNIDDTILGIFDEYQKEHVLVLLRDKKYLRWRFDHRPSSSHYYFSINDTKRTVAVAIFKCDQMFGNPVLLLMDFAFLPKKEDYLLYLIRYVKEHGENVIGRQFNLIMTSGHSEFLRHLKKIGFLRVPEKFNNRPLNLLVKNLSIHSEDIFSPQSWHVTLTDWDVL